jgi:hypothetical protein
MAARPVLAIAFAGALAGTAMLSAQPPAVPADDPGAEVTGEPAPKPRLVCRGAARTISSRIRTPRRCRTAEQWQDEDERSNRLPLGAQVTEGQNDGRAPAQPR